MMLQGMYAPAWSRETTQGGLEPAAGAAVTAHRLLLGDTLLGVSFLICEMGHWYPPLATVRTKWEDVCKVFV